MTIIVGIICKGSIVLAADSQTTIGDAKRCDAEKISIIDFKGTGNRILVAQSGTVSTSSRAVDHIETIAATRELTDADSVIQTVQEALRKVKDELRFQNFGCSAEELGKIIFNGGLDSSLMVAHYVEKDGLRKPYIHTFTFSTGLVETSKSFYESAGCGSPLANYLLSEICSEKMDTELGEAVAVYVVDKAIKHVAYCDRPIRLASIHCFKPFYFPPEPNPFEPPDKQKHKFSPVFIDNVRIKDNSEVTEIANKVSKIDEETKAARMEKLKFGIKTIADALAPYPPAGISGASIPAGLAGLLE